jgi:tRNA threonylcarbamoyladenosine modification (KEOPS) complex Cgi121 subunit
MKEQFMLFDKGYKCDQCVKSFLLLTDIHRVGDSYAVILGMRCVNVKETGKLIDRFRKALPEGVLMQAVRADAIYGVDHVINALRIALESQRRELLLAEKLEIDLLLRIACVDQISLALSNIGLMYRKPGCLVLFSIHKRRLAMAAKDILQYLDPDNSVLVPSKMKREIISKRIGLDTSEYLQNDVTFSEFLSEKAALLNR